MKFTIKGHSSVSSASTSSKIDRTFHLLTNLQFLFLRIEWVANTSANIHSRKRKNTVMYNMSNIKSKVIVSLSMDFDELFLSNIG